MPPESSEHVRQLMERHGARVSEGEFIGLVSNALHELEAPEYDGRHPELTSRVAPFLNEFLTVVSCSQAGEKLRILDLGCGTGFASSLMLERMGNRIAQLVCADISPHMLELCRKKLAGRRDVAFVLGDVSAVAAQFPEFDVVVTCSVVHHILDADRFLGAIRKLLRAGGFYLMMHEPSRRYYTNPDCADLLQRYKRSVKSRKYLDPRAYGRRLGRWLGIYKSLESKTTQLLMERGIVQSPLSDREIRQLVDVHVSPIHPGSFMVGEEGFNVEDLKSQWMSGFLLKGVHSYGFLGPHFDGALPSRWQRPVQQLAAKYPDDGCSFSALWQRPLDSGRAAKHPSNAVGDASPRRQEERKPGESPGAPTAPDSAVAS